MTQSSRGLARTWPYQRHAHFVRTLREAAARWFEARGHAGLKPAYILSSRDHWRDNLILEEVGKYIDDDRAKRASRGEGFPLHKYAHHGLSSQAMLFNLAGPLVVRDDLAPLRAAVQGQGLAWPGGRATARFEYEDRAVFNEDSGQPTSFDLVISVNGVPAVFIESKFVETKFGGCSVFEDGDCDGRSPASDFALCYLHHIGRRYWQLLEKHGFLRGSISRQDLCVLAQHYQFFREMVFAVEKGGTFVLLCDGRSPTFISDGPRGRRGLMPLLMAFVPEELKAKVGVVTVQQVVDTIDQSGRHEWIDEFRCKYALDAQVA